MLQMKDVYHVFCSPIQTFLKHHLHLHQQPAPVRVSILCPSVALMVKCQDKPSQLGVMKRPLGVLQPEMSVYHEMSTQSVCCNHEIFFFF